MEREKDDQGCGARLDRPQFMAATAGAGAIILAGHATASALQAGSQVARRPIRQVEYSVDRGATWQPAALREPNVPRAWTRWDFEWEARPGDHVIITRATDDHGNNPALVSRHGFMMLAHAFGMKLPFLGLTLGFEVNENIR